MSGRSAVIVLVACQLLSRVCKEVLLEEVFTGGSEGAARKGLLVFLISKSHTELLSLCPFSEPLTALILFLFTC